MNNKLKDMLMYSRYVDFFQLTIDGGYAGFTESFRKAHML